MKKALWMAAALALLTACSAAPSGTAPSDAASAPAQTPETAATAPAAGETDAAPVLRELSACTADRYYCASPIDESGQIFLTTVDLQDGVQRVACTRPGCTHSDRSCWAWLKESAVSQPLSLELYTDGSQLYWISTTEYGHFNINFAYPDSAVYVTGLEGGDRPWLERLNNSSNYSGNFLQDNEYIDSHWFTDGESLWALISSNPPDETTGEQTFATTLVHFVPARYGGSTPYSAQVVWRQVRDGFTDYAGLLDGQIVLQVQYPGPDTGSMAGNYQNSTSELRVLGCDGTLGEPLTQFDNSQYKTQTLLDGQWYTIAADSTDLQATDLRTGESRTLCTLPLTEDVFTVTPKLIHGRRLVVDVSRDGGDLRYVIDTETGALTTLPNTWAKDGVTPRVPVILQTAGDRCLMMVGTQDRVVTDMGQDGGTNTYYSPLSVYGVDDLDAYLDGDQNWTICELLRPDINL